MFFRSTFSIAGGKRSLTIASAAVLSFFASTTIVGCAADATDSSENTAATTEDLVKSDRALGKAVEAEWDAHESANMTAIDRADLKVGSKVLTKATEAFDELAEISPQAFEATMNGARIFIVVGNGGDDDGVHLRAFTTRDKLVASADSPSDSEPLEWDIVGDPVPPGILASRRALGAKVQAEMDANDTSSMTKITRGKLATWGMPMKEAQDAFDSIAHAEAYRWKTDKDYAFVVQGNNTIKVFNEFDKLVLEGKGDPIEWNIP